MLAGDLLKTKGGDVISVGLEATIDDVIAVLAAKNIGAVLVLSGEGAVEGIVSERDIIRVLDGAPVGHRSSPVTEVMTAKVATLSPDATVLEVLRLMTEGRFRHVPVVEGKKLLGLISIGDAVKARIAEVEGEAEALKSYISAT